MASTASNRNRNRQFLLAAVIVAVIIVVVLLGGVGPGIVSSATGQGTAADAAAAGPVSYTPPENAVLLGEDETVGYFYVLNSGDPYTVVTPPGAVTVIAGGNYHAGSRSFQSDGTEINIYLIVCDSAENCQTQVSHYTAGHLGVTTVMPGMEDPSSVALSAVRLGFDASNCGDPGCKTVHLYQDGQASQDFTAKPGSVEVAGFSGAVPDSIVIAGDVPDSSRPVKYQDQIVGHRYQLDAAVAQSVSVPENGGTLLFCQAGCQVNSTSVNAQTWVYIRGNRTDGTTPQDRNRTVTIQSSELVTVVLLNGANAQTVASAIAGSFQQINP